MIDIVGFYQQVHNQLKANKWATLHYSTYGVDRQLDCYYAFHIADFEIINVGNKKFKTHIDTVQVPYTQIYNRKNSLPDLQYLIAPDTRVPNYTTSLDQAIELANIIGITEFKVPKWPKNDVCGIFISQILASCDEIIAKKL